MRQRNVNHALLALALLVLPAFPLSRGGSPQGVAVGRSPEIPPIFLPLSAKAARTWVTLQGTTIRPLPDGTPLGELVRALAESGRGEAGRPALRLYVDPTSLMEQEITLETPVAAPPDRERERPLHLYLKQVLRPLGLKHRVHDDLVIIETPCNDCAPSPEVGAPMARAWAFLHEEVPARFAAGARLDQVIAEIQSSVASRKLPWGGLVVEFDGLAPGEGGKDRDFPVAIDLAGVPLCTALGQALKRSGRCFVVRPDGVVEITIRSAARGHSYADESDAIEGYRATLYFSELERAEAKRRVREGRPTKP